jgi:hypothetical protein
MYQKGHKSLTASGRISMTSIGEASREIKEDDGSRLLRVQRPGSKRRGFYMFTPPPCPSTATLNARVPMASTKAAEAPRHL